jgi:thioredoxin 2
MAGFSLDNRGVVVTCASCGRTNRLLYRALDRQTRCGHCKSPLAAPAAPVEVSGTTAFEAAVAESALPLVVDFWAPWCGPCRMVAPELEKLARANAGRWLVLKVNTDEQQDLASRYRIRSIPTLAVIDGGREAGRLAGARPASEIEQFVRDSTAASTRRAS